MRSWPAIVACVLAAYPCPAGAASGYDSLLRLAEDWRRFEQPAISNCLPDYGAAAIAARAAALPAYRALLHELDTRGWSAAQIVDYRLIEAEMNGLDFDLRVRQPWARDPSFYATVFG
jgi:hypothetical protein